MDSTSGGVWDVEGRGGTWREATSGGVRDVEGHGGTWREATSGGVWDVEGREWRWREATSGGVRDVEGRGRTWREATSGGVWAGGGEVHSERCRSGCTAMCGLFLASRLLLEHHLTGRHRFEWCSEHRYCAWPDQGRTWDIDTVYARMQIEFVSLLCISQVTVRS